MYNEEEDSIDPVRLDDTVTRDLTFRYMSFSNLATFTHLQCWRVMSREIRNASGELWLRATELHCNKNRI